MATVEIPRLVARRIGGRPSLSLLTVWRAVGVSPAPRSAVLTHSARPVYWVNDEDEDPLSLHRQFVS